MKRTEAEGGGSGLRKLAKSLFGSRGDAEAEAAAPGAAPAEPGATGADVSPILSDLIGWACEISEEGLVASDLDPDAGIFDAGYVDSMSYVEILARVDERYGVAVPDDQVVGSSFNDLARYVGERRTS